MKMVSQFNAKRSEGECLKHLLEMNTMQKVPNRIFSSALFFVVQIGRFDQWHDDPPLPLE